MTRPKLGLVPDVKQCNEIPVKKQSNEIWPEVAGKANKMAL